MNQNFLWICTSTHYVLHNYKVSWNSVEWLQRSCPDILFQLYLAFLPNFYVQKERNSERKNWIKITCGYAHLHIMSFITTTFQEILLRSFRGVALTNCFSSIFHFCQISKFKKCVTPRKRIESKFPVDMHIYTLCPS